MTEVFQSLNERSVTEFIVLLIKGLKVKVTMTFGINNYFWDK